MPTSRPEDSKNSIDTTKDWKLHFKQWPFDSKMPKIPWYHLSAEICWTFRKILFTWKANVICKCIGWSKKFKVQSFNKQRMSGNQFLEKQCFKRNFEDSLRGFNVLCNMVMMCCCGVWNTISKSDDAKNSAKGLFF